MFFNSGAEEGEEETTFSSMKRRSWGKPWGVTGVEGRGMPVGGG